MKTRHSQPSLQEVPQRQNLGNKAPVLVTGSHRSGTTWVGRSLALSGELGYIFEPLQPFHPQRGPAFAFRDFPFVYQYIGDENEAGFLPLVRDLLDFRYHPLYHAASIRTPHHLLRLGRNWLAMVLYRLSRVRPLLKDPFALFAAEWLADRFGMQVVVMIRHPAAFVSSLKRLKWTFDFRQWRDQPLLMADYLAPFADQIAEFAERQPDILDQAILLWRAIHHVIHRYQLVRETWQFVRYEDLAASPLDGFRALYDALGLRWTDYAARRIWELTNAENPGEVAAHDWKLQRRNALQARWTWRRRLTTEEIGRVRAATADVAAWFYSDADWGAEN